MISFRHKSNTKRIKIRTNKRLDERMSAWLQKVFAIRGQIVGFKADNKYYDVEAFFLLIDRFYNSQVDIVEGNDQAQISFTSDNLNSSSFIRPSQPNTSEINPKAEQDEPIILADVEAFQRRLGDGKEVSILFEVHKAHKKEIIDSSGEFTRPNSGPRASIYLVLHGSTSKKSSFSIYLGRSCVAVLPLTKQYRGIILNVLSRSKGMSGGEQNRLRAIEDEAPSFTTYHLQERLNQDACSDYLARMNREGLLSSYEYHKLTERVEENFLEFYRIFCEGVMDNDYESFKNEIRGKVENNLEMLLSNVEEMDLSRPISREEQRRQNVRKSTPEIEIVKVENYFEVLDQIRDRLEPAALSEIKQKLLDENDQSLNTHFARFNAREIGKEELTRILRGVSPDSQSRHEHRPATRHDPRSKGKEEVGHMPDIEEAPMFGLLSAAQEEPAQLSPTKHLSDIESTYKEAKERLAAYSEDFSAEEYGMLYHYLETNDDSVSNLVADMESEGWLPRMRAWLRERVEAVLGEHFSEAELQHFGSNRGVYAYIYENFKYDCDINAFLGALREEVSKVDLTDDRRLHKKSSDSKLLIFKNDRIPRRRYSGEDEDEVSEQLRSPSPKASSGSEYGRGSELLSCPWREEFEEAVKECGFERQKEEYLKAAYPSIKPSLFMWTRDYLLSKSKPISHFKHSLHIGEQENRGIFRILPFFSELMRALEGEGRISDRMRQWAVSHFVDAEPTVVGAFENYLLEKDEGDLVESLEVAYEQGSEEMSHYRTYLSRIELMLKEMVIADAASLEMFRYHPTLIRAIIEVFYFTGNFEEMMESLDLLQQEHVRSTTLHAATLNFSGINTNPFEYDDGSELFARVNAYVQELTQAELPGLSEWKVGKIDKEYTSHRLSVGFSNELETAEGKLLNGEEFENIWRGKFDASEAKAKLQPSEEQISMNIKMDYIFYRAMVRYVYDLDSFDTLNDKLKELDGGVLNEFLRVKFNRPASKLDVKESMVVEYIAKTGVDVLCMQEAGSVSWGEELVPGYGQQCKHDSVILYQKEKFGTPRQDLMDKYGELLDFNNDSVCLFTSRNYLIISAHLKSNKKHLEQAVDMFKALREVQAQHPFIKVIIGMDANHLIHHENLLNPEGRQVFFLTPSVPERVTTIKKRSHMQAQFKKAGLEVSEVKDHIVSSNPINEEEVWIENVDGSESTGELLPNDKHPYDHYIVRAKLRCL